MPLRRLSGLDTIFLAAERPDNPLHMMGLVLLDPATVPGGYTFEFVREFVARRLHLVPPLRRRLIEVPGGLARPFWVEEPAIDLDFHLRRAAVPSPGGPRELAAMAAEMDQRPLDRSRPLWEVQVVEGVAGGHVALVAKLHHATMDGLAGMRLMASLFSATPETDEPPEADEAPPPAQVPGALALLAGSVPWLLRQPLRAARAGTRSTRSALRRALAPSPAPAAAPVQVPRTWLNAPTSPGRAVAYTSLPLAAIKQVERAAHATVNDVLLACVGGALRAYLAPRGALPREALIAAVPLATRREHVGQANAVTYAPVALATDLELPHARLRAIRDATAAAKQERSTGGGGELAAWADVPPPLVLSLAAGVYVGLDLQARLPPLCNLVVSSVPGPPGPFYFAGARLVGIYPLGPIYSGVTLNVTALGGAETLDLGLVGDRARLPDLWELAEAIPLALDELRAAQPDGPRRARRPR